METEKKYAVLIDAENVASKYIKLIMDEVSVYGTATYKRLYGDFTASSVKSWIDCLKEYAITPVFQCNYTQGKSASDSALIIDAMDILYTGRVDGFCLVSSDSDFTKLAMRLRESGMSVIGMGEEKTPNSLVAACETFKFLDLLYNAEETARIAVKPKRENGAGKGRGAQGAAAPVEPEELPVTGSSKVPGMKAIKKEVMSIINSKAEDDGWVNLSEVGTDLPKRVPGFDPRNYKCEKLKQFIELFDAFEIKEIPNPHHRFLKIVYVKIRK